MNTNRPNHNEKQSGKLIRVGLSACLSGHKVRHDGGHCRSHFCLDTLSQYFDLQSYCPEVEAGFGTPRPAMRLMGDPQNPRLVESNRTESDLTFQLNQQIARRLDSFAHLDGYILMKNSPSCGLFRVKVYKETGHPRQERTSGLFAGALQRRYPYLPLEEEGRLNDAQLRENFILRVYAHHHFRHEVLTTPSLNALMEFHSSYKYVLMAHNQSAYKSLGQLLADGKQIKLNTLLYRYYQCFMTALRQPSSRKDHCNALQHILGYLKKNVSGEARQKMAHVIDDYRLGKVPLIAPLTLLRHYIEQLGNDYIQKQRYLSPYPTGLGLSNYI